MNWDTAAQVASRVGGGFTPDWLTRIGQIGTQVAPYLGAVGAASTSILPVLAAGGGGYMTGRMLGRMGLDRPVQRAMYGPMMNYYRGRYGAEAADPRMAAGYLQASKGNLSERGKNALARVAYNMTPYIAPAGRAGSFIPAEPVDDTELDDVAALLMDIEEVSAMLEEVAEERQKSGRLSPEELKKRRMGRTYRRPRRKASAEGGVAKGGYFR